MVIRGSWGWDAAMEVQVRGNGAWERVKEGSEEQAKGWVWELLVLLLAGFGLWGLPFTGSPSATAVLLSDVLLTPRVPEHL